MSNNDYINMMGSNDGFYGLFNGGFMWILLLLIIIAVAWAAKKGFETQKSGSQSALDVLEARYAKGEIDEEEFKQKRRELTR